MLITIKKGNNKIKPIKEKIKSNMRYLFKMDMLYAQQIILVN